MEIQALNLVLREEELAELIRDRLQEGEGVENLGFRLTPEGIHLSGEYPTGFGFKVAFETLWELRPEGPLLFLLLSSVKVGGLPADLLRGMLLGSLGDMASAYPGVQLEEERLMVDVPTLARSQGVELVISFTSVEMGPGHIRILAGP